MSVLPLAVKRSPKFEAWLDSVVQKYKIIHIKVNAYDMFGPELGFAYIQADVCCKHTGELKPRLYCRIQ